MTWDEIWDSHKGMKILKECGHKSKSALQKWLEANYPAPQKWISVEDELPQDGMAVLASGVIICEAMYFSYVDDCKWCINIKHQPDLHDVTHWMPLPEPPKTK